MDKIKVSAVSYWNTKPLLYGLELAGIDKLIELSLDIPSICAEKLMSNQVDLGLVPVAIIPKLKEAHLISDFCIGTEGEVKTVSLLAQRPLHSLKRIYLDYQSRTSVELLKILLRKYWRISPELILGQKGYEQQIKEETGALIIGDRVMDLSTKMNYSYDLGMAWKNLTGLPFVFATWVSNRPLPPQFIDQFNKATASGLKQIPKLLSKIQFDHPTFNLKDYYQKYINYYFDSPKKKALDLFLKHMEENNHQPNLEVIGA